MSDTSLRITEIFHSLQGETSTAGIPTVFVRLTGCPLRCTYCDTAYAFSGGSLLNIQDILSAVAGYRCGYVTVTGGEPLAQPECLELLVKLCDQGYRVSLETGGALPIRGVDQRVTVILDLKTPASGEAHRNLEENIGYLKNTDEVKFVICDEQDFRWAQARIEQYGLVDRVKEVLLSPAHEQLPPRQLAEWILEEQLPVRLQLQIHKQIWGNLPGH